MQSAYRTSYRVVEQKNFRSIIGVTMSLFAILAYFYNKKLTELWNIVFQIELIFRYNPCKHEDLIN